MVEMITVHHHQDQGAMEVDEVVVMVIGWCVGYSVRQHQDLGKGVW